MIRPIRNIVAIKKISDSLKRASGIVMLAGNSENKPHGIVMAAGPKADSAIQVGQKVQFEMYGAVPFTRNGETVLLVQDQMVLFIIEEDKKDESK